MKAALAICMIALAAAAPSAEFGARVVARAEGPLEPSVQNEVDHAVSRAEAWLRLQPACTNGVCGDVLGTNGLAAGEVAVKLVSSQKGGGWWVTPTNPAPTRLAVEILKGL